MSNGEIKRLVEFPVRIANIFAQWVLCSFLVGFGLGLAVGLYSGVTLERQRIRDHQKPEKIMIEKPQIHVSHLDMKCWAQLGFVVQGIFRPPGFFMIRGLAVDDSVSADLIQKRDTGELLPLEACRDIARDSAHNRWNEGIRLTDEDKEKGIEKVKAELIDTSVQLAGLHREKLAPIIEPLRVQRPWVLDIAGRDCQLVGTMDIQETSGRIRDTKTRKVRPPEDAAATSIQMKSYSTAAHIIDGTLLPPVALDFLVPSATPAVFIRTYQPGTQDITLLLARLDVALRCIQSGIFPPVDSTHWVCQPLWCGFTDICRHFIHRPTQFQVP